MYTIGIKKKWFFGYKRYVVKGHRHEFDLKVKTQDGREAVYPIRARLVLSMSDNSVVVVPNIEEKGWKIFPDFFQKDKPSWQESEQKNSTEAAEKPSDPQPNFREVKSRFAEA